MATIYFTKRDYREDMRSPTGPPRSHAVCRRITGTADQDTPLYAAHYWASCSMLRRGLPSFEDGMRLFLNEMQMGGFRTNTKWLGKTKEYWVKVYGWAWKRVAKVASEAERLSTSVLW